MFGAAAVPAEGMGNFFPLACAAAPMGLFGSVPLKLMAQTRNSLGLDPGCSGTGLGSGKIARLPTIPPPALSPSQNISILSWPLHWLSLASTSSPARTSSSLEGGQCHSLHWPIPQESDTRSTFVTLPVHSLHQPKGTLELCCRNFSAHPHKPPVTFQVEIKSRLV